MAGFLFRLEMADGSPAEPSKLESVVPNWRPGDVITLGRRQLRVVRLRDDDVDQPPVLVVEDVAEGATSDAALRFVASRGAGSRCSAQGVRLAARPAFWVAHAWRVPF